MVLVRNEWTKQQSCPKLFNTLHNTRYGNVNSKIKVPDQAMVQCGMCLELTSRKDVIVDVPEINSVIT